SRLKAGQAWLGVFAPSTAILLICAFVSLVGFVWWESKTPFPYLHPSLLRLPSLRRAFLLALAAGLGEMGVTLLPDLAVVSLHVNKSAASMLLIPFVLGIIVGSLGSGRLLEKTGPRPLLVAGLLAQAISLTAFGLAPASRELFWLAGPLFGMGLSCLLAGPLRWIVLRCAPDSHRTAAQAQLSASILVGQIAAAPLMGALAGMALGHIHVHFVFAAGASFLFVLVAAGLPKTFPARTA
ncbi:MAG TPA: MFS transporter, partial [Fibrobacteria bacterium]|nr:MFS transporter [Fibrobacteria bacterium]